MQRYSQSAAVLLLFCFIFKGGLAQNTPADSAEESDSGGDTTYWIYVHGILMSLGWVALLPLGALMAQSRWLQGLKTQAARKEVWFWAHIVIQAIGAALIIAAFGIAYSPNSEMEPDKDEIVAYTHKVLGIIAFAFLILQIVGGLVRPRPGVKGRKIFNLVHHNTGRLAILVAWVNIWLGVAIWNEGEEGMWNGSLAWIVPLAVFQGLLLIAYIVGAFAKPKTAVRDPEEKPTVPVNGHIIGNSPAMRAHATQV